MRMLKITIQMAKAMNDSASAGVTTTTAMAIAIQPSQLGSRASRRTAKPAPIPKTNRPAVLVKTKSLLSTFSAWAAQPPG